MKISKPVDKIHESKERNLSILVCFIIGFTTIQGGVLTLLRSFIELPFKLDVLITFILYVTVVVKSTKTIFKRIKTDSIIIFLTLLVTYYISLLIDVQNYSLQMGANLIFGVFTYTVIRTIRSYDVLIKFINIMSILSTLSVIIVYVLFPTKEITIDSYSQTFAYAILPSAIISFNAFMSRKSILHLTNFAVAFLLVIIAGARGPFFISFFYILVVVAQSVIRKIKNRSLFFIIPCLVFIAVIYFPNVEKIITKYSFKDSNRILEMIESDIILEQFARESLREKSLALIFENPFGMGLGQERVALSYNSEEAAGSYPHNLFLEIFLQYGIYLGLFITILLIYLMSSSFLNNNNIITKDIWLMFLSLGFLPLMFSATYTNWPGFWVFLALNVNILHENKLIRKNKKK